jgi:hypothetical protein
MEELSPSKIVSFEKVPRKFLHSLNFFSFNRVSSDRDPRPRFSNAADVIPFWRPTHLASHIYLTSDQVRLSKRANQ